MDNSNSEDVFLNLIVQKVYADQIQTFMKTWMRQESKDFRLVFIQDESTTKEEQLAIKYAVRFSEVLGLGNRAVVVSSVEDAPKAKVTKFLKDTSSFPYSKLDVLKLKTNFKEPIKPTEVCRNTSPKIPIQKTKFNTQDNQIYKKHIEKVFFKIIIPNYNNIAYIKKCLDSILEQTFQNFKIIIVDDLSTDGSNKFCEMYARKYPNKIIYQQVKNKSYSGICRNIAIDYPMECQYIWAIDGDDYLINNTVLNTLYSYAQSLKYDAIFFNGYRDINGKLKEFIDKKPINLNNYENCDPTYHYCSIVKPKCFKKYLENCIVGQDLYHSYLTLDSLNTYININEHLYVYRFNQQSISNNAQSVQQRILREQHREMLKQKICELKNTIKNKNIAINIDNRLKIIQNTIDRNKNNNNKLYNIVYIFNDAYVIPTIVSIFSLIKSNSNNNLSFYLISSTNLSKSVVSLLQSFNNDHVEVQIIYEIDNEKIKQYSVCNGGATNDALLKFEICNILPQIDKCLYLDGDTLIKNDITSLYSTDIDDCYAAVVKDSGAIYSKSSCINAVKSYFNSGVMLLNLNTLRQKMVSDQLFEKKKEINAKDKALMDQPTFNYVFENHVKLCDPKWNTLITNLIRANSRLKCNIDDLNNFYKTTYKSFDDLFDSSAIIHYASKQKPWNTNCQMYNKYMRIWREIYDSIPWSIDFLNKDNRKIVIALASFPARKMGMLSVIKALRNQCDRICIWLNDYDEIPEELKDDDKLEIILAKEKSCLRENGRLYWVNKYSNAYYLTVDDDIDYPPNYVKDIISKNNLYPNSIISYHGAIFTNAKEKILQFVGPLDDDMQVHRIGGGVACMIPSKIGFTIPEDITQLSNWDGDASISVWATKNNIKKYCLARSDGWLKQLILNSTNIARVNALCLNSNTRIKRQKIYSTLDAWEIFD